MPLGNWLVQKIGSKMTRRRPSHRSFLCDFDRICHEVRPADVLLIEGRSRLSRIIQKITLSPWSHSALYIGRLHDIEDPQLRELIQKTYQGPPSDQLLLESIIGKGTIISSLKYYENDHIRICRPDGLSHSDAQHIVAHATQSLGTQYNIRNFFDLGRFLLKSKLIPPRWRSTLFTYGENNKPTKDICSAMIAESFMSVGFPILPHVQKNDQGELEFIKRNPKLYAPCDFDYSPYFKIIKYPIFPDKNLTPYRNLPWVNDLISNDHAGIATFKSDKDI